MDNKLVFAIKIKFLQICTFLADSKSRAQELSNDVSFVIFGHQTWDLERILVFKYPSRDRVNRFIESVRIYCILANVPGVARDIKKNRIFKE